MKPAARPAPDKRHARSRAMARNLLVAACLAFAVAEPGSQAASSAPNEGRAYMRAARSPSGFFPESLARRDPLPHERSNLFAVHRRYEVSGPTGLVAVLERNACAAALLAADSESIIVASATHCFAYDPARACAAGRIVLEHDLSGLYLGCERVLVQDEDHDVFVFEARPRSAQDRADLKAWPGLLLSACDPAEGRALKMIGYPNDRLRQGRASVTENCEVLPRTTTAFEEAPARSPRELRYLRRWEDEDREMNSRPTLAKTARDRIAAHAIPTSAKHNCTTWGGNSGGPIVSADFQSALVGLPLTYVLTEAPLDRSRALRMEGTQSFVERNLDRLRSLGIQISRELCDR